MTTKAPSAGAPDGEADFGSALRGYRLAAGLSQRDLAERSGLSARGVQNLERGVRRPYAETARRLARGLGLNPLQRAWLEALGRDARAEQRSGQQRAATRPSEPSTIVPEAPVQTERKPATALSLRIAHGPARDEAPSATALRQVADTALEAARTIVERHGGAVVRIHDGGLVAVFGVPFAQEDHAARAIQAARSMLVTLTSFDGRPRRDRSAGLRLTIGLESGALTIQRRGADWQIVEAVPSPTDAAERIRQGAPVGSIRAGAAIMRAGGGSFAWHAVNARPGVFELDLRASGMTGPSRGVAGRAGHPFVGRETELRRLRAAWEDVRAGHGRVVALVGEAGIGKSRLLAELRHQLGEAGAAWYEASCLAYAEAIPFSPFRQVLRARLGLPDAALTVTVRTGVLRRLVERGIAPERAAYLAHVLGYNVDDRALLRLPPEILRDRAVEAAVGALLADTGAPWVLALEDVHWLDRGSEAIVAALAEAAPTHRLLLLLTGRTDALHPWTGQAGDTMSESAVANPSAAGTIRAILAQPHADQIVPARLTPAASETLIRNVVSEEVRPALIEDAVRRAGGNPLFAEELARALVEEPDGGMRVSAGGLALPQSIQAILLARIDRLPVELKRVLQAAATIGSTFGEPLLGRVLEARDRFDASLLQLQDLEFVTRRTPLAARQYAFRHELVQATVYETLSAEARASLHECVGRAVEALAGDALDEQAELLAYHFSRGRDDDKAVEYLALAGRRAAALAAVADADAAFDEALRRLAAGPDSVERRRRRIRILADRFSTALLLGLLPAYVEQLAHHEAAAHALDDPALLSAYLTRQGACAWATGRPAEGRDALARAAALAEAADDDAERGAAYTMLARCELDLGAFERALAAHERASLALERRFDPHWYMWTQTTALWAYAYRGDWEAARSAGAIAVRAGEAARDPVTVSTTLLNLALVSLRQGDTERALAEGRQAVERAATPADRALAQGALAVVECARGNAEQALPVLDAIRAALGDGGLVPAALFGGIELGSAYLAADRPDLARATLTTCHALAVQGEMRYFHGRAARLLGDVAVVENDIASASALFDEAIDVLSDIGAQNDLALAYAGRGALRLGSGDPGPGQDDLSRARALFARLGTAVPVRPA